MSRLDRYMWRELLVPFLIGTVAVVLMFQANYLIFQFKTFSLTNVPITATLQMLMFETPAWLNMTLPVGTSLAASLAVSRMTRESELTAMRSAGASILRVLRPLVVFGLLVAVGNFLLAEKLMPPAKKASRNLAAQIAMISAAPEFKSNVTLNLADKVVIIGTIARGQGAQIQLSNILLYEKPNESQVILTRAATGTYQDGIWTLDDPKVWMFDEDALIPMTPKKSIIIKERVTVESLFQPPQSDELTSEQLLKAIQDNRKQGMDTRSGEIDFHSRFSVPAACIIFALVSPIFAVFFSRTGAFMGVLLSILVVMLYYNAFIISTQILGPKGMVNPWLAAWLPNIIFVVAGFVGLRRLE